MAKSEILNEIRIRFQKETSYAAIGEFVEKLDRLIDDQGPDPEVSLLLGHILRIQGEWEQASNRLEIAISHNPDRLDLIYEAALITIDAGNYQKGKDFLCLAANSIDRASDRHLRGIWRAGALVGLHSMTAQAYAIAEARKSPYTTASVKDRIATGGF